MPGDSVEPFADNWAYLRAELNWLDRLLGMAVARQRKETKEVEHFARNRADRATIHWWKGLVSFDGAVSYDSPAEMPRPRSPKVSYQQQMEAKIRASQIQGVSLGLPCLRNHLHLTLVEKNLVLMALAPEISRRYGQLYNYLQETERTEASGLPTVDLILRILCRNEAEWRDARQLLVDGSILVRHGLLEVHSPQTQPFLSRFVKLTDPLTTYLLADCPNESDLQAILQLPPLFSSPAPLFPASAPLSSASPSLPSPSLPSQPPSLLLPPSPPPPIPWDDLILPAPLLKDLQHICDRIQVADRVDNQWSIQDLEQRGTVALLIGASGTGKTMAAQAISSSLERPLYTINLSRLNPSDHPRLLAEIANQHPQLLLLKAAETWFGRTSTLSTAELDQFLADRRRLPSLTLLCSTQKQKIRPHWQRQLPLLEFPIPDPSSRIKLWQRSFPSQVPLDADIDWVKLAHQFRLSGGMIRAIAREAAIYATSESPDTRVSMRHLIAACQHQTPHPLPPHA